MARQPGSPVFQGMVAAACLAIGIVLTFVYGLPMYRRAESSLTWPTTSGIVQAAELKESSRKGKKHILPGGAYSYDVNGRTLASDLIWASGGNYSSDKNQQQAILDTYSVGSTVKVFYDPENTEFAILEPGITSTNYIVLGGGGVIMLVGVVLAGATIVRVKSPAA